jgi:hypothetical protein
MQRWISAAASELLVERVAGIEPARSAWEPYGQILNFRINSNV